MAGEGEVLDLLAQPKQNTVAAVLLMRELAKKEPRRRAARRLLAIDNAMDRLSRA